MKRGPSDAADRVPRQTARFSPDHPAVGVTAIVIVMLILTGSYLFSFASIAEAAAWSGAPDRLHVIAPLFIDGPILAYTLTYTVFRYRGEPSRRSIVALYVFTTISTVVNVAHALTFNQIDWTRWETWIGGLIAATAPLSALLTSEEVIRLALVKERPPQGERLQVEPDQTDGEAAPVPADSPAPATIATQQYDAAPDESNAPIDDAVWSSVTFDEDVELTQMAEGGMVSA
ncbi:MAG: DUF2637 domain-containing protein [Curtobacterium sp.]